jgi:hypothetical protein
VQPTAAHQATSRLPGRHSLNERHAHVVARRRSLLRTRQTRISVLLAFRRQTHASPVRHAPALGCHRAGSLSQLQDAGSAADARACLRALESPGWN